MESRRQGRPLHNLEVRGLSARSVLLILLNRYPDGLTGSKSRRFLFLNVQATITILGN